MFVKLKHIKKLIILLLLGAQITANAQNLSNAGKEFWVGWGNNVVTAGFVLYVTSENFANISITIPGNTTFTPVSDLITPGQVKTYDIPYATGIMISSEGTISNKAVHITSDANIVAYAHQYAGASSAATMLMPVESYGQTYYSLNITQVSNYLSSYSYFFVIASEDNTRIEVTPSVLTQGGIAANTTVTVNLNKGQIYNVFGRTASGSYSGNDVSGSKVKSIVGSDGNCHPFGMFSGSSRITLIGSSGGDVVQQQIFPSQAWGTRYLTSPTVSTNTVFNHNPNVYRVAVRDPATIVRRNGVILSGLQNNFFYEFQSNNAEYIQADKPILVSQYIPSEATSGYDGSGDPEMFYLSPIEQGIKSAKFNATKNQDITANFVNVIVPTISANTLRIDNSPFWDDIYPHPGLPGYTVKVKRFAPIPTGQTNVQHSLTCDTTFTAITYGLGSVETYGYNAGTLINNLEVLSNIQNTEASTPSNFNITCPNTPFIFKIRTIYKATQMQWLFSQLTNFSSPTDVNVAAPIANDSALVNGIKYYTYSLPATYQFTTSGTYNVPVKIFNPTIDNCNNSITAMVPVEVKPGPSSNFTFTYTGCKLDTAVLHGTPNTNGFNLAKYKWTFDNGDSSLSNDTTKFFPLVGVHPTKFRVLADNGCAGDTTINITTYPNPTTNFGITLATACVGSNVVLTDTSAFGGGPVTGWFWNFGNGQTLNPATGTAQTISYSQPGDYTILHVAKASRCVSDTVRRILHIWDKPHVNFSFTTGCLQDSATTFFDNTTLADVQTLAYAWNFGDANATVNNPNTSILQNPLHKYSNYNTNQVKLVVTTEKGCIDSITKPYAVSGFAPPVDYSVLNETLLCSKLPVKLSSLVNVVQDSIYRIEIYWDTLAQPTVFDTDITPLQGETYSHNYAPFTTPATKQITVRWIVYSKGGCVGTKTKTITLNAMPAISFTTLPGTCINGGPASVATATISNGLTGTGNYFGTGVDANGTFHPDITGAGIATVKYAFATNGGCADTATQSIRVFPKPVAGFKSGTGVCLGDSVLLKDSSSVTPGTITQWQWSFGDNTNMVRNINTDFYRSYTTDGTYTINLKVVSDSGCNSDVFTKSVAIGPLPITNFTLPAFICMPAGNATFTNLTTISNGTTSLLQYNWDFGDGSAAVTGLNPTHIYAAPGNYLVRLTATSAAGCKKDSVKILNTFYDQPIAAFSASNEFFCQGEVITFNDSSRAPNSTITNWSWSFGDATFSTTRNPPKRYIRNGLYDVTLVTKNSQGCISDTARKQIQVYLKPLVSAGPAFTIAQGQQIVLQGLRNDSAVSVLWTPASTLNNDTLIRPTAQPLITTIYTITGTGEGSCTATSTVKITVLKKITVPNAFSPNNDGINDRFEIRDLNDYFGSKVQIFDRYGQRVFESVGYNTPWDGTYKGKPLPVGVYYYIINLNQLDYQPVTGSVMLLR